MKLRRFYGPWFILGCLFLFEPTIKLVDLLPNTVGYLLIAIALKEISALEYRIENACRLLYYAAGVGALRFGFMFSMFSMNNSDILTAVTVLGVLEAALLIYFFVSFYSGLTYLAQRSESENIFGGIGSVRTVGIFFAIVHTAATILPELTALLEVALDAAPDDFPTLTLGRLKLYKNYAIVITALISFIAGVWWLKETTSFIRGVKKDLSFRASIEKRYCEYVGDTPYEEIFIRLKGVLVLMVVACVFCTNFRIYDEVALHYTLILPAWVATLIYALCARRLGAGLFSLVPYAAYATVQFAFGHLLTDERWFSIGEAVIPVAVFLAAVTTERLLRKCVLEYMNVEVKFELLRQHIAFGLYMGLSVANVLFDKSWLHALKVLCFIAWAGFSIWTYSAIKDEIKLRRKTH